MKKMLNYVFDNKMVHFLYEIFCFIIFLDTSFCFLFCVKTYNRKKGRKTLNEDLRVKIT